MQKAMDLYSVAGLKNIGDLELSKAYRRRLFVSLMSADVKSLKSEVGTSSVYFIPTKEIEMCGILKHVCS